MGFFSETIDFENYEPYEVIQAIMEQFSTFRIHILDEFKRQELKSSQPDFSKRK